MNLIYCLCISDYDDIDRHWGHWVDLESCIEDLRDIFDDYYPSNARAEIDFIDTQTADVICTVGIFKADMFNLDVDTGKYQLL